MQQTLVCDDLYMKLLRKWRLLADCQLDEMGELFEEIEQFGKDGFEDAVAQIARVEETLGIADIAQFTPPPPKRRRPIKRAAPFWKCSGYSCGLA